MPTTQQQIIAGLYIAFFNRAPDKKGLDFWQAQAETTHSLATYKALSASFAQHPQFTDSYDSLSNQDFVTAIYSHVLGVSGDEAGIRFWTKAVNDGISRSDMVAEFIYSTVAVDLTESQWDELTTEQKALAQCGQDTLLNKITTALYFVDTFAEATNITQPDDLENDAAYLASIEILKNVDHSISSVFTARSAVKPNQTDVLVPRATDTTPPTAIITLSDDELRFGETSVVAINFSEVITELSLNDFTVPHGSLSNLSSDNNQHYTALFTPTINIVDSFNALILDLSQISDNAANTGLGIAKSSNFTLNTLVPDTTAPVITGFSSTTSDGIYTLADEISISATSNESVLAGDNITAHLDTGRSVLLTADTNGRVLNGIYTITNGDNSADLTVTGFTINTMTDSKGNVTTSTVMPLADIANVSEISVDTTAPIAHGTSPIAVNDVDSSTTYNDGDVLTFKFAEAISVAALDLADFSVNNGHTLGSASLAAVAETNGLADTFTITLANGDSTLVSGDSITITASSIIDQAGNTAVGDINFIAPTVFLGTLTHASQADEANAYLATGDVVLTIDFASNDYSGDNFSLASFALNDVLQIDTDDGRLSSYTSISNSVNFRQHTVFTNPTTNTNLRDSLIFYNAFNALAMHSSKLKVAPSFVSSAHNSIGIILLAGLSDPSTQLIFI